MATVMKTPGVYIVEKNAFPGSVVEVATAVPAFIGYTEKTEHKGRSLLNKPRRISSLAEYRAYFGSAPPLSFSLIAKKEEASAKKEDAAAKKVEAKKPEASAKKSEAPPPPVPAGPPDPVARLKDGTSLLLARTSPRFHLYHSMWLFFQNGGGPCYVVTVGDYDADVDAEKLKAGIDALVKEQEPTMVVVPDAVLLSEATCADVQKHAMGHCRELASRFAILDVFRGYEDTDEDPNCIAAFRNILGINDLDYGAAYYPWLETTAVAETDLSFGNLEPGSLGSLKTLLKEEAGIPNKIDDSTPDAAKLRKMNALIEQLGTVDARSTDPAVMGEASILNKGLVASSPAFKDLIRAMQADTNRLPPSGAMAGIYTYVDDTRGVWKAPANVSLAGIVKPSVNISHADQEDLNVTPQGKSVNAIRSFVGEGTLVWGARTLDGNSLDWRYINVRRTMIMLEQSIKLATKSYVFESNDANTWITIKSMIRNFLTGIWKRGGLAGASPDDAFSVHVGLGETMTAEDILEGILRVTVLVAVTRPAEFIEITFQQQMQKS